MTCLKTQGEVQSEGLNLGSLTLDPLLRNHRSLDVGRPAVFWSSCRELDLLTALVALLCGFRTTLARPVQRPRELFLSEALAYNIKTNKMLH